MNTNNSSDVEDITDNESISSSIDNLSDNENLELDSENEQGVGSDIDSDDDENSLDEKSNINSKEPIVNPNIDLLLDSNNESSKKKQSTKIDYYDSDSDEDEEKFFKFKKSNIKDQLSTYHSNLNQYNNDEIEKLSQINLENGIINDEFHKTTPILTKYEKTRILGFRAKQINLGNKPFIEIPEGLSDGYQIALLELEQKKMPFIIRRPLPNGSSEFWKVKDLEIL